MSQSCMTAGVLRQNPHITWTKEHGKDPASVPWFTEFQGERINDHHLTIAEKQAAREQMAGSPKTCAHPKTI
jgi:hypothetical protein